ncbi:hypothetical protein E1301_Tti015717 [Triplophysa tibetana]|uniref:Uncharacterized protein n=1 Tax=Triplophysa tibetana TaxID=1572043 RepID=A0A5A9MZP9_9TELE|nr:hypothetical protein E1301_Tti015717 [Triplophysa tibetana]
METVLVFLFSLLVYVAAMSDSDAGVSLNTYLCLNDFTDVDDDDEANPDHDYERTVRR